jgi:polyisoprenoid-binding protein YceI
MTTSGTQPRTRRWVVDPERSTVEFRAKGFWGLSTVTGRFSRFDGIYADGQDGGEIDLTVEADSLDTGNRTRDKHLREAGFFDVHDYPEIRFTSTNVVDNGNGLLHVFGELEAGGGSAPLGFDATKRELGDEIELETTVTVDQRNLGMDKSPLGMVRTPSILHVRARLIPEED